MLACVAAGQIPTYLIHRRDYSSPAFEALSQILQDEVKTI